MKFLIIHASPHQDGGTARLAKAFRDAAERVGTVRQFNLHDDPPPFSTGNMDRPEKLSAYQQAVLDCDALFIATPTYWFNVPSVLKAFIENIDGIEEDLWKLPKILGIGIYAPEGGELGPATALVLPLNHLNFTLVHSGYVFHRGIPKDDWAWDDLAKMPERMARLARMNTS